MFLELMEVILRDDTQEDGPSILRYTTYQKSDKYSGRISAWQEAVFSRRLAVLQSRQDLLFFRILAIRYHRVDLDSPEYSEWDLFDAGSVLAAHEFLESYDAMADSWHMLSVDPACQC